MAKPSQRAETENRDESILWWAVVYYSCFILRLLENLRPDEQRLFLWKKQDYYSNTAWWHFISTSRQSQLCEQLDFCLFFTMNKSCKCKLLFIYLIPTVNDQLCLCCFTHSKISFVTISNYLRWIPARKSGNICFVLELSEEHLNAPLSLQYTLCRAAPVGRGTRWDH